jgi:hypothetical protein
MMVVYFFLELAAFFVGCVLVRKSWPAIYRFLVVFKGMDIFIDIATIAWSSIYHRSNHWIVNLYVPVAHAALLYIFYNTAVHPLIKRLDLLLLAALPPLIVIAYWVSPVFYSLNSIADIACLFLVLLSSCGALVDLLLDKRDLPLFQHPLFWLAGGMLLYCVCTILYFLTWEYSKKMILYRFFYIIYFTGGWFFNLGIIGCIIFVYRQWPATAKSGSPENTIY